MARITRTEQFCVKDIGFWKDGETLPRRTSLEDLLTATTVTMKISNQKNGRMGQTLHHESTGLKGVVAAHILSSGGTEDNLLCDVYTAGAAWTSVEGSDIICAVRAASKARNFHNQGINPDMIGAHSLRAGGAMALKIMGYSDSSIQKFGRWTSDTWQMHIHSQISKLQEEGVAHKMSIPIDFHNIAFIEPTMESMPILTQTI